MPACFRSHEASRELLRAEFNIDPPASRLLVLPLLNGKLIHDAGGEAFILADTSTLGRSRDAVVPVGDPRASRQHALIRRQPDGFWFFDLGSSNGSYINERRVTTAQLLRNGDQQLRFEGGAGPKGASLGTQAQHDAAGRAIHRSVGELGAVRGPDRTWISES